MQLILALVAAGVFPVLGLGFVLWMARFEDTLPASVRRTGRRRDPPPVLTIPVQRAKPEIEVTTAPVALDRVVRSRPI